MSGEKSAKDNIVFFLILYLIIIYISHKYKEAESTKKIIRRFL